jgi:hypothetical protein
VEVRVATRDDLDGVTETLTAAFESDPLWSWAFPELADEEEASVESRLAELAENLALIDAEGMPAYLESSNAAVNDARYEGLGFVRVGEFKRPDERLTVSTMWRDGR